jgi:hypothetical protein
MEKFKARVGRSSGSLGSHKLGSEGDGHKHTVAPSFPRRHTHILTIATAFITRGSAPSPSNIVLAEPQGLVTHVRVISTKATGCPCNISSVNHTALFHTDMNNTKLPDPSERL